MAAALVGAISAVSSLEKALAGQPDAIPFAETLTLEQAQPGNIFTKGNRILIPVRANSPASGDRVSWTLYDFSGRLLARGTSDVVDREAFVEPPVSGPGYFELQLERAPDGKAIAEARTSIAVLDARQEGLSPTDSHFGVMTHFAQGWDVQIMPLIARAGILNIRDEQYWNSVEQVRGVFTFPPQFDRYMAAAASLGLQPLTLLTFGNDLYDGGMTPFSEPALDAYARYGQTVLRHYASQIQAVEVWNEFNGTFATGPVLENRPHYYAEMLKKTWRAIKAQRPEVTIVGGAAVPVPLPYFEKLFAEGALESMDAVAIHPYRDVPEGVEYEIEGLKNLIARYNHGKQKPIWATEIGKGDDTPDGRRNIARYLVRLCTILRSENVEKIYWYLLRDYNEFKTMGLLRDASSAFGPYAPAPAYAAYANLIRQLDGATFLRREKTDPRTRIYLFENGNEEYRVAWTTDGPSTVSLTTKQPLRIIEIDGREHSMPTVRGEASLNLTDTPVFVEGSISSIVERRRDRVLTDSEAAFSGIQGEDGWYYGYFIVPNDGAKAGKFVELTWLNDDWSYYWGDASLPFLKIGRDVAHPSQIDRRPIWAVRRWQSPIDGKITISGYLERAADEGDGVEAQILVDGQPVYSVDIGGPDRAKNTRFAVDATLHKGSIIDFGVSPGPAHDATIDSDATAFHVFVTRTPK